MKFVAYLWILTIFLVHNALDAQLAERLQEQEPIVFVGRQDYIKNHQRYKPANEAEAYNEQHIYNNKITALDTQLRENQANQAVAGQLLAALRINMNVQRYIDAYLHEHGYQDADVDPLYIRNNVEVQAPTIANVQQKHAMEQAVDQLTTKEILDNFNFLTATTLGSIVNTIPLLSRLLPQVLTPVRVTVNPRTLGLLNNYLNLVQRYGEFLLGEHTGPDQILTNLARQAEQLNSQAEELGLSRVATELVALINGHNVQQTMQPAHNVSVQDFKPVEALQGLDHALAQVGKKITNNH